METLLGSIAFALFVTAQVLAVIAVHAAQTEVRGWRSSCKPDDHQTGPGWHLGIGLLAGARSERMKESYQPAKRSWPWPLPGKLGDYAWSPMAWIFLGLFALAEFGNWQMGSEIGRVCELLRQESFSISTPD